MNVGVVREVQASERRVALTPAAVARLTASGHTVWVERGAGDRAMFHDSDYIAAGAFLGYSEAEVVHRSHLIVKVAAPTPEEAALLNPGSGLMAFYHLAVKSRRLADRLLEKKLTAIGYEIIEDDAGRLPVLAAISEIAGQMAVSVAAHLLQSSSGGRGILLGPSPGLPPAHVVVLGAGAMGSAAARTAARAGARVTVLDVDTHKLEQLAASVPGIATELSVPETVAAAVASADVLIAAALVAGQRAPHLVTRQMVESMRRGSVIIDAAIDQGGCVETSRPMTSAEDHYVYHGVVHYTSPNMTSEVSHSASTALAAAVLPYVDEIAAQGIENALAASAELRRGVYTHAGLCRRRSLSETLGLPWHPLEPAVQEETRR